MQIWIEFLRVALPMILLLALLPAVAAKMSSRGRTSSFPDLLALGFVRTALFLVFLGLLLGEWKLYLPGVVFSAYAVWIVATAVLASRNGWLYDRDAWTFGYARLLRGVEQRGRLRQALNRTVELSQEYLFLTLLIFAMFLHFAWNPLFNLRFSTAAGYAQTLLLGTLLNGSASVRDASVSLLAPIALASGLDAATVVRLSLPLLYLLILGAIVCCSYAYSGSAWAAVLAVIPFWLYSSGPGKEAATTPDGTLWATLVLIAAVGAARRSVGTACCGLLLVWLLTPSLPELFFVALASLAVGLVGEALMRLAPPVLRKAGVAALFLLGLFSLAAPLRSVPANGPFQYESAARAADRIAREFPRNRWIVVSPMHEAAFVTGRGWHKELPQFLEEFPATAAADKAFRIPFEVADIFLFVEKRPLPQIAKLAVPGNSSNSFYYATSPGRTSMAFRAAEFIAAYSASHSGVTIFHDDDDLIVYQIHP